MKKGYQIASLALVKEPAFVFSSSWERFLPINTGLTNNSGSVLIAALTVTFGIPSVPAAVLYCCSIHLLHLVIPHPRLV